MHLSLHLLSIVNYNRNIEEAQLNTIRKKLERGAKIVHGPPPPRRIYGWAGTAHAAER